MSHISTSVSVAAFFVWAFMFLTIGALVLGKRAAVVIAFGACAQFWVAVYLVLGAIRELAR